MALATSNRDGGRTSESGHLRAIMKGLKAQVMTGLNVTQRGAGANMSVDVQIGDAIIPRSDGTYGHPAWADAIYNVAITTADVSNPRRDIVVMYIDYGQTPSTGVSNNTNGVVKIIVVAGTPAGSPSDPSNANIQSAVGASNPYIKLARVRVAAGASSITNSVIDDLRLMATGIMQGGWTYDDTYTWTYVSASSFAIAGVDVTSQFPKGARIALYQGGSLKFFTVVSTVFSTNTTVTVEGGGTYTLTNVPIDKPAFSYMLTPVGFPRQTVPDPYDVYSTSEVDTGKKWTDGRPIYRKVLLGNMTVAVGTNNISHGLTGLSAPEIVNLQYTVRLSSTTRGTSMNLAWHREAAGNWSNPVAFNSTTIGVYSSFAWGASAYTIIMEYVK